MEERNFLNENVELTLSARSLFFIGQTLMNKNNTNQTIVFINSINKSIPNALTLETNLSVNIKVTQLIEIIELLGKESEFLYSDFNKTIETSLITQITELANTDLELAMFIQGELMNRKTRIEAYKTALINNYIQTHNIQIND